MQIPCWFSPKEKAVAEALIQYGCGYYGLTEDFGFEEEYVIIKCGQWRIASTIGECCCDVECNGALFSICFEEQENPDFSAEIKRIEWLIRQTEKAFDDSQEIQYIQLSLF